MDIVLVTYNSSKWIERCFNALSNIEKTAGNCNIFVVDNMSTDNTCELLEKYKGLNKFTKFEILKQDTNLGFGKANNLGAKAGEDDIIVFINIDTEIQADALLQLEKEILSSDEKVVAWEMRQIPYEHPKYYDPVTGETSWMSGAAFAVKRDVFLELGGFDDNIFMYAEDVDLSWRIRSLGYTIKYCPKVMIHHYSYEGANQVKPTQYLEAIKNNLLLRYRYGDWKLIFQGYKQFYRVYLFDSEPFEGAKKGLRKKFVEHMKLASEFKKTKVKNPSVAKFLGWDYEIIRDGAFLEVSVPNNKIKVSIIVRTCQRPTVLRETLISLRNQTYSNFEVVVVEDGEPTAKKMILDEFTDLDIKYYFTGEKVGRSAAGNLGLEKASGEYYNFLDDDDLFFADHIETLVNAIEKTDKLAVYSYGFETPVIIHSQDPFEYTITQHNGRYKQPFDKVKLCHHNYIPIQCIMFSRKLYEELGGFDTTLEYLEDWDLWVRYMQMTDFECVPKTTSLYKVPVLKEQQTNRQDKLDEALKVVRKKHESYYIKVPVSEMVKYGEDGICQWVMNKFKFK